MGEWSFQFRAALRGAERGVLDEVSWIELATGDCKQDDLEMRFVEETDLEQLGAEIYDTLCSLTSDEPLTLARGEAGRPG